MHSVTEPRATDSVCPRMCPFPYTIRAAIPEDVPAIPDVERGAVGLFQNMREQLGLGPVIRVTSEATLRAAVRSGRLWVAVDETNSPVGFALVFDIDGCAHLHQLNVLPDHGRKGLGRELLRAVCEWAREREYPAVTLSTFRDVPWNGPFWSRLGFRVLEPWEISPGLAQIVARERERGMRTDLRVVMRLEL